MSKNIRWALDNPHPFSQMKTELILDGRYDEYVSPRRVNIDGCAISPSKDWDDWLSSFPGLCTGFVFDLGNPTVQKTETYLLCITLQFDREIPQMPHSL